MRCQLFEYTGENLDTGVDTIDEIEKKYAYKYILTLTNTRDSAEATPTIVGGQLTGITIVDSGSNYFDAPSVSIIDSSGVGASVTSTVDSNSGGITSLTITNPGTGYTSSPTIKFGSPSLTTFQVGETVLTQSGSTQMRAEVVKYSDSDDKLHLIHAGADDGVFHTFSVGKKVIGLKSGAGGIINLVVEDNQLSQNEQNDDFSTGTDFIDFSENNPFGDASNN